MNATKRAAETIQPPMHSVLIVDDDEILRGLVSQWVQSFGYDPFEASTAERALEQLHAEPADIAVCDINMPGQDGVWLATQIRHRSPHTAIVMATNVRDVDAAVATLRNDVVDYVLKPFDRPRLGEALSLARDWHIASAGDNELHQALQDRLRIRHATLAAALAEAQSTHEDALDSLISMLELHERDGRGHATRVARLTLALADELEVDESAMMSLEHGALLHDIGKLRMPASILSKPAPLTDLEWQLMRTHPQVGHDLLSGLPALEAAAEIVLAHHEAYNGSGYPNGLKGEEIPFAARILTIADSYDSMTHPHTQRPAMPAALAIREIERCSGTQFDPEVTSALGIVLAHATEVAV
jgi:putative two-component system response regulator